MACLIIVMRTFIVLLSLAVSMSAAAAEFQYVIPFAGFAQGNDGTWLYSYTVVTNLSPRPATVQTTDVYPVVAGSACSAPAPFTLAPNQRIRISPMVCMGRLSSLAFVSDEPLSVRTELDTKKASFGSDRQIINAFTEWIPAGVESVTEAIIRDDAGWKANLVLINPNETPLVVTVVVDRPEVNRSTTLTFDVAPKSTRIVNVPELRRENPTPFITSGEGRHMLRLSANGDYQAGFSSMSYGVSMYVPATPLVP
jgi:hypothetical protein